MTETKEDYTLSNVTKNLSEGNAIEVKQLEMGVIRLKMGDVLIVRMPGNIRLGEGEQIMNNLATVLPEGVNLVAIVGDDIELEAIRPELLETNVSEKKDGRQ